MAQMAVLLLQQYATCIAAVMCMTWLLVISLLLVLQTCLFFDLSTRQSHPESGEDVSWRFTSAEWRR